MDPVKETLKELSTKLERGEVSSMEKEETAHLIYHDALRKAVSLRVEEELQAIRLYNSQRAWQEIGGSNKTLRDYVRVIFRHKATLVTTFVSVVMTVYIGLQ